MELSMVEKITQIKHIRKQLEKNYQKKYNKPNVKQVKIKKYKGLGLNWKDIVILMLTLFFVGLYQVQAHAQSDFLNLDEINTGMMLSYNKETNNYSSLQLLSSNYEVDIVGIIAQVKIKQNFINNSNLWLEEGMYAFPVAKNSAVDQMKMLIGERIIEAEIHEKKQAQQIYQTAKDQDLTASIVKQYRPNLFTTDVANIMPGETIKVEISYQQTISYDNGYMDFRLPLKVKARFLPAKPPEMMEEPTLPSSTITDLNQRAIKIKLEAGFELSELKSLNHDVIIKDSAYLQSINLSDQTLQDRHDFVLRWKPQRESQPKAALFTETLGDQDYVLLMVLPPNQTFKTTQKRELVFIIDTSGSMHGQALNQAKDALLFGMTQINPLDKFNIIEFNSYARKLFPDSVFANPDNLDSALDFIDSLISTGGTNMAPALKLAMQNQTQDQYLKQIVFVTDGSVANESEIFKQIKNEIGDSRLFSVAIGQAPNNYFMNKAATVGRGSFTNIGKLNQVDESMNHLFKKLSSPALTDIEINWNQSVKQNPKIIPDLYSDQPIIVTAKMKKVDPNIFLSGYFKDENWNQSIAFHQNQNSPGVAKLWARNQIEDLTDDYMLATDVDIEKLKFEITKIALQFHLVSQFTSLVAVDKNPDLSKLIAFQAKALNNNEVLSVANFPKTNSGWIVKLILGFVLLSFALFLTRSRI